MKSNIWKKHDGHELLIFACLAAMILIMVAAAVYVRGVNTFKRAEQAFMNRDHEQAMVYYERTILWYLPFNARIHTAIARLWEIGRQAETEQKQDLALKAYGRLRSSLYAIQSLYSPYEEWISKCDQKLTALAISNPPAQAEIKDRSLQGNQARTLPHAGWALMMEISFWGWISSTVGLIWRGSGSHHRTKAKTSLCWIGIIIGFYLFWLVSLTKA